MSLREWSVRLLISDCFGSVAARDERLEPTQS
jgi:hypothetical protein